MTAPRIGIQWSDEPGCEVVLSARGRSVTFPCNDMDEARALADHVFGLVHGPEGDAEIEAMLASEAKP